MKVIACTRYGSPDALQLLEVEKPVPKDDEVLVKINATSVTAGDCELRNFKIPPALWLPLRVYLGIKKPRQAVLGMEFAGEIVSVGKLVTAFKKGDRVFAASGLRFGAYAEYKCQPADYAMALAPVNLSDEEAAVVPVGGLNALHFIRKAGIRSGQKVLVYGASGSIGTYAVQLAIHFGAEVTAVGSRSAMELLRSLGATQVIDYTAEDFTSNKGAYDVVFDAIGKSPFAGSMASLKKNGRYLLGNPGISGVLKGFFVSLFSRKKVITGAALETTQELLFLKSMIEAGKLKPVIDRHYPLEKMQEAHAYVEKGHKTGNVAIVMPSGG